MIRRFLGTAVVAAVAGLSANPASAEITTWTVQSTGSALTISGALSSGGEFVADLTGQPNTPNSVSMTTTYTGTIDTHQNVGGLSTDGTYANPIDIQFLSANLLANNSGNWDPNAAGTGSPLEPAAYGLRLNFLGGILLALRDVVVGLGSDVIPLTGTAYGNQSASGSVDVTLISTVADYRAFGIVAGLLDPPFGSLTVENETSSMDASLSISYSGGYEGTATMVIPVNFVFAAVIVGQDTDDGGVDDIALFLNLVGNITATAPTATVPEAGSLVLLGMAASVVSFVGYRRKTRKVA